MTGAVSRKESKRVTFLLIFPMVNFVDSAYTERYMGVPKENEEGYRVSFISIFEHFIKMA